MNDEQRWIGGGSTQLEVVGSCHTIHAHTHTMSPCVNGLEKKTKDGKR